MIKNKTLITILFLFSVFFNTACSSDAGTRVGNPPTTTSQAFPDNFAIVSPFETSLSSSSNLSYSIYTDLTSEIESILNGDSLDDCPFDTSFDDIFLEAGEALCYAPPVRYQNFPNGDNSDGELPKGDVGLWHNTELNSEEACLAAQLNQRLNVYTQKSHIILKALASMICVANVNDIDLPDSGSSIDLTDKMSDMLTHNQITTTTINAATITTTTSEDSYNIYTYALELITPDEGDDDLTVYINMIHMPMDDTNTTYRGLYNYRYNRAGAGTCLNGATEASSVMYNLETTDNLKFHADDAFFCTQDVNPFNEGGTIMGSDVYDPNTNPDGWVALYSSLRTNIDPETLLGDYAYSWTAGYSDNHARSFNIHLEKDNNDDTVSYGFFGLGPAPQSFLYNGRISGFICNFAGPGAEDILLNYVQYQKMTKNNSGIFEPTASNIEYSPQNECEYLSSDSQFGNFTFELVDGNMTDPNVEIRNNLLPVTDVDNNGYLDEIEATGFTLPIELNMIQ